MRMKSIIKHILESAVIIFCIISINFLLMRFMPGDPVEHIIGEDEYLRLSLSNPLIIEEIRAEYGLDRPLRAQYLTYLGKTVRLDFGNSYRTKTPVLETVLFRLRWTLLLTVPATVIAGLLGGWLGMRAGWEKGGVFDTVVSPLMIGISTVPTNCMAIIFLLVFAFKLGAFPIGGITSGGLQGMQRAVDILWHMVLPLSILVLFKMASNFMLMKSTVQTVKDEEYITVAVGKGFTDREVQRRHVLKNALCPYLTSICMQFGHMMSGSMMIEVVFSWKGMGTLIYDSVGAKDFPMLQTSFLFIGICVVTFNLLSDLVNMAVDPRIREGIRHE